MKKQLKRTWGPFFARFGRLTPVQAQAVPVLLEGRDAVICAPTASGKTEAAVAPLVERYVEAGADELVILYVVPTRALVNDLIRRLEGPLGRLRATLFAKTGDHSPITARQKPQVLVTTPESLDSLLCRQPRRFESLRAVILDEVHLVDGGVRGDQVRILLRRLPHADRVQRVVLSATVHDPKALAARYARADAEVLQVGEPRALELTVVHETEEAVDWLRATKRHKAIWFCNTRRGVEETALGLQKLWPKDKVVAHHGSLSRRERTSAEEAMQRWPWGLCVATMTLEIGIDIGDVDAVVLDGPPPTPSAFRQRVGRACRRESRIAAVGIAREPGDDEAFALLDEMAQAGEVEEAALEGDLSTVVQQTLSILFGNPTGMAQSQLADLLAPLAGPGVFGAVLAHLEAEGWVERPRGGRLRATTQLMDAGEKGRIHSNVPDSREHVFRDAKTGRPIGAAISTVSVGDTVVIGGAARTVVSVGRAGVQVSSTNTAATSSAFRARRSGGAWRWLLPEELR